MSRDLQAFPGGADARPRIHIWPRRDGSAEWSVGPIGKRNSALSPGSALDWAIEGMKLTKAVVIVEGYE